MTHRTAPRALGMGLLVGALSAVGAASAGAQSLSACTVAAGVTTYPTGTACFAEPTSFSVTVYEAGLCTSAPSGPTATSALATGACETTFSNAAGSTVSVSTGATSALSGTFTAPPAGTYTHGYIIVDKDFQIAASVDFGAATNGDAGGNGRFCATNAGSVSTGNTATCSAVSITGATLQAPVTDFDGGAGFSNSASETFSGTAGSVSVNAWLVTNTGQLAASAAAVQRLVGVQTFSSPITVGEIVTGMNLGFNTTAGMTIIDNGGATVQFNSGPFRVEITVTE
ncbi:MAG: hypothetical protein NXI21_11040 [Alphaproteobacteria bacterium]|nr:hypothetical protein [Alphaproteobacteria bacterium]